MHALARPGRLFELTVVRLIVVRMLEDIQELTKRPEVPVCGSCFERGLHAVIARDERGIDAAHVRGTLGGILRLACEALAPAPQPIRDARGGCEQLE